MHIEAVLHPHTEDGECVAIVRPWAMAAVRLAILDVNRVLIREVSSPFYTDDHATGPITRARIVAELYRRKEMDRTGYIDGFGGLLLAGEGKS
jgi:hypothetical protein